MWTNVLDKVFHQRLYSFSNVGRMPTTGMPADYFQTMHYFQTIRYMQHLYLYCVVFDEIFSYMMLKVEF